MLLAELGVGNPRNSGPSSESIGEMEGEWSSVSLNPHRGHVSPTPVFDGKNLVSM